MVPHTSAATVSMQQVVSRLRTAAHVSAAAVVTVTNNNF